MTLPSYRFEIYNLGPGQLWFWRLVKGDNVIATSSIGQPQWQDCTQEIRRLGPAFQYAKTQVLHHEDPT